MKVSIAISTYEAHGDGPKLLSHNLDHILMQDYDDIEIVISDHSTSDIILDIVESYKDKKYPIIYVRNTEKYGNISNNINNAIDHCSGDFIKIIFMDDYLLSPSSISIMVKLLETNPDKHWLVISYVHTKNYIELFNLHKPSFNSNIALGANTIGAPSCVMFRESSVRFDDNVKHLMDCDFYFSMYLKYGLPLYYSDIPLLCTLLHDNQVTNTDISKQLMEEEDQYIKNKYSLGKETPIMQCLYYE